MGADQTVRPSPVTAPAVEPAQGTGSAPKGRAHKAQGAGGGGNAYAASLATPAQEQPPADAPGMLDWAGAVMGSKHLRTMLGPTAKGVQWDDTEKGANRMEVDIWGKDEVRVPKLRIASVNTAGASAKDVHADGIKVNERDKSKSGKLVAEITVGAASAKDIAVTNPELQAAGIDISAVKVHREFEGKRAVADVFSAPGPTTVEVGSAAVRGLRAGGVSLDAARAKGVVASTDGAQHKLNARTAEGTGLAVGGVRAGSVSGTDLRAQNGPDGTGVSLAGISAGNVTAGDATVGSLAATGFAARQDKEGVKASLGAATAKDVKQGGLALGEIGAVNLTMAKNSDILTAGAGRITASGVQAGGATLGGAEASGLSLKQAGGNTDISATSGSATGITAGGASMASAAVAAPTFHHDAKGNKLGAASGTVSGARFGSATVDKATVTAPTMSLADGVTSGGATSAEATGVAAGGVNVASLGVAAPSFSSGPNGVSGSASGVTATDLSGTVAAKSAVAHNVSASSADGVTTAAVGDAQVSDLAAGGMSARQVGLTGGAYRGDAAGSTIGAKSASLAGVSGHGVSARGAQLTDAGVSLPSAGGVGITAGGVSVDQFAGGGTTVDGATASGLAVNTKDGATQSSARRLAVTGVKAGDVSIASGHAEDARVGVGGGKVDVGAGSIGVRDLAAPGIKVGGASATGAQVSVSGDSATAHARSLEGTKLEGYGASAASARTTGVDFARDAKGTRVGVGTGAVSGLKAGDVRVAEGAVANGRVNVGSNGTTTGTAGTISGSGIVTPAATIGAAKASKVGVTRTARSTTATADSVGVDKLHAGGLDATRVDASDVDATLTTVPGGTQANGSVSGASASGVAFRSGGTRAKADRLRTAAASVKTGPGGTSVDSAGISGSGVSLTTPGGVAPMGQNDMVDMSGLAVKGTVGLKPGTVHTGGRGDKPLVQQAAGLVDSARLTASVPMTPRTQGSGMSRVTTKPGTTAYVEVRVAGGKLVPSGTKASFSKPLDTWAWTSVPGVYLTPEGKLYASVDGLFDMNMTEDVNKAIGAPGKTLPLGVSALASHAGTAPEAGGPVISATLGQGQGANVASVSKDGDRSLSVNFSKLLLDALGVQTADAKVDVKSVRAENAGVAQSATSTTMTAGTVSTGRTTLTK